MKKYIPLLVLALTAGSLPSGAQALFTATEYLDVNKIRAAHMVHGDMWRDLSSGDAGFEFPRGSGKHCNYMGAIWMSGSAVSTGKLHISAARYRAGVDYWPGPLDLATGSITYATATDWAKIWKINRSDVETFRALASPATGTIPVPVLEWPAKGNIYAKGAGGASLIITTDMAPFVDVNSDGIYNPKDGDYPDMKGDQMLWWVFNDNGPLHTESKGLPLKIEYHASAYAYNRGTDADRMVFYEFIMHNRSAEKYNDFRFGLFSDADLGNPFDDYIAFDSVHRMGIEYNAAIPDGTGAGNTYGAHPPITGLTFLEMPGDSYPSGMLPAGTFNYFENGVTGPYRDPNFDSAYYRIMHAQSYYGLPMPSGRYAFPVTKGAVQCDEHYPPADRRYVITSDNYGFQPGTTAKIAMAFIVTDTTGNACPGVDFKPLTHLADTAWKIYHNPLPALSSREQTLLAAGVKIWPNPAQQQLFAEATTSGLNYKVYDLLGRHIPVIITQQGNRATIDLGPLAPGVYALSCSKDGQHYTGTFTKQ